MSLAPKVIIRKNGMEVQKGEARPKLEKRSRGRDTEAWLRGVASEGALGGKSIG